MDFGVLHEVVELLPFLDVEVVYFDALFVFIVYVVLVVLGTQLQVFPL